jgi:hypothetical protein
MLTKYWPPRIPATLLVLFATLVGTFVLLGISSQLERTRRTSVADARILAYDWPSRPIWSIAASRQIRFAFEAAGATYTGSALQNWSVRQVETSKVCYDPADPSNHALVPDIASCP